MVQIAHRETGAVLFEVEAASQREAVVAAVDAEADLAGADLSGADLSGANLSWAGLTGADLTGAELSGADLTWAGLSGADLTGAELSGANLSGADLTGATLTGADLGGADLDGAFLAGGSVRHRPACGGASRPPDPRSTAAGQPAWKGHAMAEVPAKALTLTIDWHGPDEAPSWWDHDQGPWESTGSWAVYVDGHGEILTDTTYSNDDGFKTLGEAVTAAEKWATDRRMEIKTFGVTMRAIGVPLQGNG